jgi:hypothetical protein
VAGYYFEWHGTATVEDGITCTFKYATWMFPMYVLDGLIFFFPFPSADADEYV